jgi:hypothetical protein
MQRGVLLGLAALCASCGSKPTLLLLTISSSVAIDSLWVTVSITGSDGGIRESVPAGGGKPSLPGTLAIQLPDIAQDLTVQVEGISTAGGQLMTQGMARSRPHEQTTLQVALGPTLGDGGAASVCGPGDPATACAGQGYLFCDGFEDASGSTFPSWSNTDISSNAGTSLVASDGGGVAPCRGNKVAETTTFGATQSARVYKQLAFPNPVYLRTYVYIKNGWPAYSSLLEITDWKTYNTELRLSQTPGQFYLSRDMSSGGAYGPNLGPFSGVTAGAWACVEWFLQLDPAAGHSTVFVNGDPVADFPSIATVPQGASPPAAVYLGIGATSATETGSADFLFDEFVVSSSRIGCSL